MKYGLNSDLKEKNPLFLIFLLQSESLIIAYEIRYLTMIFDMDSTQLLSNKTMKLTLNWHSEHLYLYKFKNLQLTVSLSVCQTGGGAKLAS